MQALRRGNKSRGDLLICSYFAKPGTLSRVTVIVSKKVSKLAHERNRLKRQVRAAIYPMPLPAGDIVIQMIPQAKEYSYLEISTHLSQCLRRFSYK